LEIIEANYSVIVNHKEIEEFPMDKLEEIGKQLTQQIYQNYKAIKPRKKLEIGEFREIKKNKTKIINKELSKHKITKWNPN
jgi:hypothetical protein